jgi:nucleotide-binding universal stress UspA family protein
VATSQYIAEKTDVLDRSSITLKSYLHPQKWRDRMSHPEYVVMGMDDTPHAIAALRRAGEEARLRGARLDVVRVNRNGEPVTDAARTALDDLVASVLGAPSAPPARCLTAIGVPGEVLIRHAADAALLVIGAGYGERPLDGSTVSAVLRDATCPVLVCTAPDLPGRMSYAVRFLAPASVPVPAPAPAAV